jgi:hypothetical protein
MFRGILKSPTRTQFIKNLASGGGVIFEISKQYYIFDILTLLPKKKVVSIPCNSI